MPELQLRDAPMGACHARRILATHEAAGRVARASHDAAEAMNANEWVEPQQATRRARPELRRVPDPEGPAVRLSDLTRAMAARIRERPLTSLAVAVGAGFVVGGALSLRAGRLLLAAAARHVGRALLKQIL